MRYDKSGDYSPSNCYWGNSCKDSTNASKHVVTKKSYQEEFVDVPNEVWRPIAGYECFYEVSNLGRVRSLMMRNGSGSFARKKLMTQHNNGHGYKYVSIRLNGKRKNFYVHRLVADAFVPNPNNLPVVDHIDFDKTNNNADNLQWMTQKQNVARSTQNMSKPRKKAMTNTGERYISRRKSDGKFYVTVFRKSIGAYKTLEEAITARDIALKEG